MRFIIFIAAMCTGFLFIRYSKWLVDNTGITWPRLEKMFGPAVMYSVWKVAGVVLICASFYVLFGGFGL